MTPLLLRTLREHRTRQREGKMAHRDRWEEHDLVFPSTRETPMDARNVIREWHADREAAGVRPLRFHALRHSCASLLYATGADDRAVMAMLRHTQIGATMNIYTHLHQTVLRGVADRLDALADTGS